MSRFAPADGAMRIVTAEILDQIKDNALLMLDHSRGRCASIPANLLIDLVAQARTYLNVPLADSILEDNAKVYRNLFWQVRERLGSPVFRTVQEVLEDRLKAADEMEAALEYLSGLHPRRCLLSEVTRAREALQRYKESKNEAVHGPAAQA